MNTMVCKQCGAVNISRQNWVAMCLPCWPMLPMLPRGGGARGHYLDPISKDTVGEQEGVQEVNGEEAEVCQSLELGGQWTAECAENREQRSVCCAECCVLCDVCCVMCDVYCVQCAVCRV